METDLETGYIIEGFNVGKKASLYDRVLQLGGRQNILYDGKTSEIPEEIAGKVCNFGNRFDGIKFQDYSEDAWVKYAFEEPLDSILSACTQPYCIIYKQK